jgi:hypothetical protein
MAGLGDRDRLFRLLDEGADRRTGSPNFNEPLLRPFRADPRFQRILKQIGLTD